MIKCFVYVYTHIYNNVEAMASPNKWGFTVSKQISFGISIQNMRVPVYLQDMGGHRESVVNAWVMVDLKYINSNCSSVGHSQHMANIFKRFLSFLYLNIVPQRDPTPSLIQHKLMSSYRGCGVDKLTDLTKLMSSCSDSNSHGREIVHLAIGSLGQTNCWLFGLGLQGHTIQLGIITRCHNFFWNPCKSMSPIFERYSLLSPLFKFLDYLC